MTLLTQSQRKDYARMVETQGFKAAWAICQRDCIMRHGDNWWHEHREEVKQELATLEKREE